MGKRSTVFNGIGTTYTAADLAGAKEAQRRTPYGVYYIAHGQVGKKTAGYTLLKEAHHTSDDVRRSKTWLHGRTFVLSEVGTARPESATNL